VSWHGGKVVAEAGIVTHLVTGEVGASCTGQSLWTVTPDWVFDSVKMGKRADEVMYNSDMVMVTSSRSNIQPVQSALVKPPVLMKSKYQNPSSSIRSLHSMPTVIASMVSTSQEERFYNDEASSPLQPQKLSFPLAGVSIFSEDRNGNSCGVGRKGRLESITEGEELEANENGYRHRNEFLCSSLEDMGKELESIDLVVDDLAMINIHDNAIGDNEDSGDVNDFPPEDERIAVDVLKRGLNKRSQPSPVLTGPKIETPDKSKRRKSVRLAANPAFLSSLCESSVSKEPEVSAKKVTKPVPRMKEQNKAPGLARKLGKEVLVDGVKVHLKVRQQMSVDIIKESKDVVRKSNESKATPGDLGRDDEQDLLKVDGEKVTRRRSVRLQEKPQSEKSTRRRSTRHMSSDYYYY